MVSALKDLGIDSREGKEIQCKQHVANMEQLDATLKDYTMIQGQEGDLQKG